MGDICVACGESRIMHNYSACEFKGTNNTDKLKPIMRCGAGCGTSHDCAFPDCVDIEATLETLKARESEIEAKDKEMARLRESLKLIQELAGARSTDEHQMDACLCEIWYIADSAKPQKGTE